MKIEISALRTHVHNILEIEHNGLARVINTVLMLFIAFTLVIVFIETVPSIYQHYKAWFYGFELVSILIFSIEYIARVWASAEVDPDKPWACRLAYILSPLALIDLLAIAPFYLGLFIQIDTRYLRVVRLFRVMKFTRYSHSLSTLLQVLKNELPGIISALSILLMLIVLDETYSELDTIN